MRFGVIPGGRCIAIYGLFQGSYGVCTQITGQAGPITNFVCRCNYNC